MRARLLFALLSCLTAPAAIGQESLPKDLANVYENWRSAVASRNLAEWKRWTASPRQALTRNLLVSQKKRFPEAMFSSAASPPSLAGLQHISTPVKGPTANSIYRGKVGGAGDSLIVFRYFRVGGSWKYDSLSVTPLPNKAQADLKAGRLDFLNDPAFQPSGELPLTPKPCPTPDYVADVHLVAIGYKVVVEINGISKHSTEHQPLTELVIGGLKKGKNRLSLRAKALPETPEKERLLKVTLYAKTGDRKNPAIKVFDYAPNPVAAEQATEFLIDPAKLGM